MLPAKTLDCLKLASMPCGSSERMARYKALCQQYGENVVCSKMESLARRNYIEYGVSPRTGWLTPKGHATLEASTCQSR